MREETLTISVQTWMVRVWHGAYDDENFADLMSNTEYHFATKEEALAFKEAFNDKFWNHGGWKPRILENDRHHDFGSEYVAGEPAEGPYEYFLPPTSSVDQAIDMAFKTAKFHGMEEEE